MSYQVNPLIRQIMVQTIFSASYKVTKIRGADKRELSTIKVDKYLQHIGSQIGFY
jgi:hypothetical protein